MDTQQQQGAMEYAVVEKKQKDNKQQNVSTLLHNYTYVCARICNNVHSSHIHFSM